MKFDIILLAAGDSKRFGENKLIYKINGKEMYRGILDAVLDLPEEIIGTIVLVTQYDEILRSIENLPVIGIKNNKSELGISYSIQLGINILEETGSEAPAVMFAVCDQPHVKADTLKQFLYAYQNSRKSIGAYAKGDQAGNPVIFARKYMDELKLLTGDTGGKMIVSAHKEELYLHQVEGLELQDYDRKTDEYRRSSDIPVSE